MMPESNGDHRKESVLRNHWKSVKQKHATYTSPGCQEFDLSPLPADWAIISINVTVDHKTMFISRHQKGYDPLVFCLPLDRQGRREGENEEDLFSFDVAVSEMKEIVEGSDKTARNAKHITSSEGKAEWWVTRRSLDKRLEELLLNLEFVWLGPFKVSCSKTCSVFQSDLDRQYSAVGEVSPRVRWSHFENESRRYLSPHLLAPAPTFAKSTKFL